MHTLLAATRLVEILMSDLHGIAVSWMQSGSLSHGIGMAASFQRFSSLIHHETRICRRTFSLNVKSVRQADGASSGASEATPPHETYKQLPSKVDRFRWGAFGEQALNFPARPKTSTSKPHPNRHFTSKAHTNINPQPNYAWKITQLASHVKDHDGASSCEISNARDGRKGRSESRLQPGTGHDAKLNRRGTLLLAMDTEEGSNIIAGTRLLNQDLGIPFCKPANEVLRHKTKEKPPHSRQPQSSLATKTAQLHGPPLQPWQVQKRALFEKFGSAGWCPRKRLSPDVLESIRTLNSQSPEKYTTPVLAEHFKVSPEAIRRILKSKWRPSEEEQAKRRVRWGNRGKAIWSQMVEIGIKPPKKWRNMGVKRIE